jgi:uncharacterized protein YqhQ
MKKEFQLCMEMRELFTSWVLLTIITLLSLIFDECVLFNFLLPLFIIQLCFTLMKINQNNYE